MQVLKPKRDTEKISNKKTGEVYKNEDDWKAKGVPKEDIKRDVTVIMPSLDLFGKNQVRLKLQDKKPANKDLTKYANNKRTDEKTIT